MIFFIISSSNEFHRSKLPKIIGWFLAGNKNGSGFKADSTILLFDKGGQL